jgi:hypothetical protein
MERIHRSGDELTKKIHEFEIMDETLETD